MRRFARCTCLCLAQFVTASSACARRPALPTPIEIIEYTIPWENAFPSDVVVDGDGRVWFTDRLVHVIGRFDPETASFTQFAPPSEKTAPYGLVQGDDGALWYAGSRAGLLGRIDPATGHIEEHRIRGASGGPQQLAWTRGRIWFSLRDAGALGRFDPATGESRIIEVGSDLRPYGIAVTPGGHVWFSTMEHGYLIEVDPETDRIRIHDLSEPAATGPFGVLTCNDETGRRHALAIRDTAEYAALPDSTRAKVRLNRVYARARRLAADSSGSLWLTDFRGSRVIRFDPGARTHVSWRSLGRGGSPYAVSVMRSGAVVYSETGIDAITILDPESGERSTLRIPTQNGTVRDVWIDERRAQIWLPLSDAGRLAVARLRRDD